MANTLPLDQCCIAFNGGGFPDHNHASLSRLVKSLGGSVTSKVNAGTTHLVVSSEASYKSSKTGKISDAKNFGVQIVTFDWLADTETNNARALEANYDVDHTTPHSNAHHPSVTNGQGQKKRSIDAVRDNVLTDAQDDDDVEEPQSKKKKGGTAVDNDAPLANSNVDGLASSSKKTTQLHIPLDENCTLDSSNWRVYIGDGGLVHDVSLNQTNAGNNNNKFYRIQLLEIVDQGGVGPLFYVWTRFGRVGETGQVKPLGPFSSFEKALREFEKKFKDKTGHSWANRHNDPKTGKYTYIERNYEPESDREEEQTKTDGTAVEEIKTEPSKLLGPVQDLMRLIFNQKYFDQVMAHLDYDAKKMPLGRLSKRTLAQGYQALKDIAVMIRGSDPAAYQAKEIEYLSNTYYSYIPHDFGRRRPPVINAEELLKREIALLESLGDMQIADEIMKQAKTADTSINPLDRQYNGLGLEEMTPLAKSSNEFKELEAYLLKSKGSTHYLDYQVQDIFRIERRGEFSRFDASKYAQLEASNRRLLWHGSRATNFGGILSQGLRIAPPEAPVSGYMFGKGVYLADMSSKSANYCYHYQSGGEGILLLCEAELGDPMLNLVNADYNAGERASLSGCYSTWGMGTTAPQKWKDAGCVHQSLKGVSMPDISAEPGNSNVPGAYLQYNEYIVYDVAQIRLRYLFRVKM